jgi:hypothetical protein
MRVDPNISKLNNVLGHFRYLDITASAGDILINELDNNISTVPLPGAVWMFGARIGGLGLLMRRRKRSVAAV